MKINGINFGFISALILLTICANHYGNLSIFITFFFCLYTGKFFFRKESNTAKTLQRVSFFVNVCSAVIITFCFEHINNTWFSAGQDDFTFHNISSGLAQGQYDFRSAGRNFNWHAVQYKLYILIFAYWYKFLSLIGINGNFFFHLNIINSFVASFIAPFIYKIGLKLFGEESSTPKKAAFFCLFFPTFIYYSAIIIRDTWVICFFLMAVYFMLSDKSFIKKLVLIFVLIITVFYIRKASAVFISMFIFIYALFNTRNSYIVFFIYRIVPVVMVLILAVFFTAMQLPTPKIAPAHSDVLNYVNYITNYYRELATSESAHNSIGLRLRLSNNPIVVFIYHIYFYFSPIPPKFIKDFNIITVFLGIGNLLWYLLSPLYFIHAFQLKNSNKKVFIRAFFWFLILVLVIVGTTTGVQRHLLLIYPIVLLFAVDYILNHKKQFYRYVAVFFFLFLISGLIYALLKMII